MTRMSFGEQMVRRKRTFLGSRCPGLSKMWRFWLSDIALGKMDDDVSYRQASVENGQFPFP